MTDSTVLNRWRDLAGAKFRPLQASLELTYRCNERCTHCYIDNFQDDPKKVLALSDWQHVLRELRVAGSLYLILMGGEAMLNRHFWEILKSGADLGFHVSMITNGLKVTSPEVARRLFDHGLSVATVSLYSLDSRVHDRMTSVPGSCEKTKNAIRLLREAGVTVGINCLLTSENVAGYFELADWCIEQGIEIKADPMITPKFSGDLTPTRRRLSEEQLRWYYETMARKWSNGSPKPVNEALGDFVCNVGKGKCAVTAYGDLLTCIEVREPLGNLLRQPFAELWNGPIAQKWREMKVEDITNRPNSPHASFCDHCPGMALHEHQDPKKMSLYALLQGRIKTEVHEKFRVATPASEII